MNKTERSARTFAIVDTELSELSQLLINEFGLEQLPAERFREADFLLSDTFHFQYLKYSGVRVLVTAENHPADLNEFDYTLTHDLRESERRLYFPYYRYRILKDGGAAFTALQKRPPITEQELIAENRKFCAFVCRNGACRKRNRFVRYLSKLRNVDCGGPFMNNIGYCVPDKIAFQREYLFSIAYENEASPGYLTEKIMDAFFSRSIPIYWGDPHVTRHFNPEAFVHARDFRNKAALAEHVLELSRDPKRMVQMLNAPVFLDNDEVGNYMQSVRAFFSRIIERGPGALQRTRSQRICAVLQNYYGHGFFRTLRRISRALRGME